jgi:hypothetical protein
MIRLVWINELAVWLARYIPLSCWLCSILVIPVWNQWQMLVTLHIIITQHWQVQTILAENKPITSHTEEWKRGRWDSMEDWIMCAAFSVLLVINICIKTMHVISGGQDWTVNEWLGAKGKAFHYYFHEIM